jgi:hypothetical protein
VPGPGEYNTIDTSQLPKPPMVKFPTAVRTMTNYGCSTPAPGQYSQVDFRKSSAKYSIGLQKRFDDDSSVNLLVENDKLNLQNQSVVDNRSVTPSNGMILRSPAAASLFTTINGFTIGKSSRFPD